MTATLTLPDELVAGLLPAVLDDELDPRDDAGFIAALGRWAGGAGGSWWLRDVACASTTQ